VECRKFQEHITAAVDNVLEQREKAKLDAHLAQCPRCKSEFESEKLMRNVVKSRCQRTCAPSHVLRRINDQIDAEAIEPERSLRWKKFLSSQYVRPAIGFALACIAVVILLNNNTTINTPRVVEASLLPQNDIIKQSLVNYLAVVKGEIKPTLASSQVGEMKSYFEGKTEFPVVVPTMNNCILLGGVLNDFGGKALAHVVYRHNNSGIIYVYETCWETVLGGSPFHLAQDVQDELKQTNWYTTTSPDGYTLVLWTNGKTLCSAVSTLDENTLKALLSASQQKY